MLNFPNPTTEAVTADIDARITALRPEHIVLWLDALGVSPQVWKGRLSYLRDKQRKLTPGERYIVSATRKIVTEYLTKTFNARPRMNCNAVVNVAGVAAIANLLWKVLSEEESQRENTPAPQKKP